MDGATEGSWGFSRASQWLQEQPASSIDSNPCVWATEPSGSWNILYLKGSQVFFRGASLLWAYLHKVPLPGYYCLIFGSSVHLQSLKQGRFPWHRHPCSHGNLLFLSILFDCFLPVFLTFCSLDSQFSYLLNVMTFLWCFLWVSFQLWQLIDDKLWQLTCLN